MLIVDSATSVAVVFVVKVVVVREPIGMKVEIRESRGSGVGTGEDFGDDDMTTERQKLPVDTLAANEKYVVGGKVDGLFELVDTMNDGSARHNKVLIVAQDDVFAARKRFATGERF